MRSDPIPPKNVWDEAKTSKSGAPLIVIWYGSSQVFAQWGKPQRWINILGRVSGPHHIASLKYSLNGEMPIPISVGPDRRRLAFPGDFNIEIDHINLVNGMNIVNIIATDRLGNQSREKVNIEYSSGRTWPVSYAIDWIRASSIQEVAQIIDGMWTLEGGKIRPVKPGYDRLIAVGDISWRDYEIAVPITIHGFDFSGYRYPGWGPGVGVLLRWQGHHDLDGKHPRQGWWPLGALGWYRWRWRRLGYRLHIMGNKNFLIAEDNTGRNLEFGVSYIFKMRVETPPGETSFYCLKVWEEGKPEPEGWDLSGSGPKGELNHGSALLVAHHADASFGNVTIVPVTEVNTPFSFQGVS